LESLKLTHDHILSKKVEIERDNTELKSLLENFENELSGLKLSIKNSLKSSCHLETRLSIIRDEIAEYKDVSEDLESKSAKLFSEEIYLKSELQKLKNDVSLTSTEYFNITKKVEKLRLKKERQIAKIVLHKAEIESQSEKFLKEREVYNSRIEELNSLVKQ
jgi:chromosome segregation ATPase